MPTISSEKLFKDECELKRRIRVFRKIQKLVDSTLYYDKYLHEYKNASKQLKTLIDELKE